MTFGSATASKRLVPPSHKPWTPLPYMQRGVDHLLSKMSAGLALDPGLGKTSITLDAFCKLQNQKMVRNMLVIAPLRVCRKVWRQEGAKWSEFRHLKFTLLHGPKKTERLKDDADIFLINPEGVAWLASMYAGRSLPFDIVTIDELTKFKNAKSDRSKALRPRLRAVRRRWGLTGNLAPNGYMDLFGQQLMLDDGAALGKYITHYRESFFQVDFNGFDYNLMPGAEKRIIAKIAPSWLQMSAADYLDLPPIVPDPIYLELDKPTRAIYDKMKKDMLAELPEGVVTGANAAAVYSKLSQMANGAVYVGDGPSRVVSHIHDIKLDALSELVEELNGQPLLVAYEFNHDFERLRERFGVVDKATGKKVLPYLGKGTTEKQESEWIDAWNRNELPILACHPASAGHGLNLQEGNAGHVCWFGITWDLELYFQFIRRLCRNGNEAARIVNHLLIVNDSIDELKLTALDGKDMTQSRLLRGLNAEILRDAESPAVGRTAETERLNMSTVAKLARQSDGSPATPVRPSAWNKAAGTTAAAAPVVQQAAPAPTPAPSPEPEAAPERPRSAFSRGTASAPAADTSQQERIKAHLTGTASEGKAMAQEVDDAADAAAAQPSGRSAFSAGVQAALAAVDEAPAEATIQPGDVLTVAEAPAPAKTTRKRTTTRIQPVATHAATTEEALAHSNGNQESAPWDIGNTVTPAIKVAILQLAFANSNTVGSDGMELANQMLEFVRAA